MTSQFSPERKFSKSKEFPDILGKFPVEWRWNHVSTTYHLCGNLNRKITRQLDLVTSTRSGRLAGLTFDLLMKMLFLFVLVTGNTSKWVIHNFVRRVCPPKKHIFCYFKVIWRSRSNSRSPMSLSWQVDAFVFLNFWNRLKTKEIRRIRKFLTRSAYFQSPNGKLLEIEQKCKTTICGEY